MPRSSLATALKSGRIRAVDFALADLCGVLRGKRYNRAQAERTLAKGFQFPPSIFGMDAGGDPLNVRGIGVDDGDPDLQVRPLPSWEPQPWMKTPTALVLCEMLDPQGEACATNPRTVLQKVVADFTRATGLKMKVAFEGEYFLIAGEPRSNKPPRRLATVATESTEVAEVYSLNAFVPDNISARLWEQLQKTSLPLGALTHEAAASQYEINLNPADDPVTAADQWVFLRHAITSGTATLGARATFCPKPFHNLPGSGLQINISLWDKHGPQPLCDKATQKQRAFFGKPSAKRTALFSCGVATPQQPRDALLRSALERLSPLYAKAIRPRLALLEQRRPQFSLAPPHCHRRRSPPRTPPRECRCQPLPCARGGFDFHPPWL